MHIFLGIGLSYKKLLIEAFFFSAIYRVLILFVPFNKIKNRLGIYKIETPLDIDKEDIYVIKVVTWSINTIIKYTPWKSKCLVQALTAQRMLTKRKISTTLYLGVKKDKDKGDRVIAHAWLRAGHIFVTGGYNKHEFTEVARFGVNVLSKNKGIQAFE
jgi:hypothetical protein